jgi:cytochrome P450
VIARHERLDGWVVQDAPTAIAVLRDAATWSSDRFDGPRPDAYDGWVDALVAEEPALRDLLELSPQALVGIDPPDHGRLRAVLRRAFAPASVDRLGAVVARELAAVLPSLTTGAPVDVVALLTRPLPFRVVASLLGVEPSGWDELERLAHAASTDDTAGETRDELRDRLLAELGVMRFFSARVEGPASADEDPRVLPELRRAVVAGEITVREAAGLCREVLVAGADSVGHLLAGALDELARDPARAEVLRGDPAGLDAFVEERLAADPPFTGFWRRATAPTTLAGVDIPPDGLVLIDYALANRTAARHLSFGHGIHFCLGAALARLEARIVLGGVLAATTSIAPAGRAERLAATSVSGLRTLPLRLTGSAA